ncbi:MAG: 30S ribosomal protein S2 [Candidatus Aenigmarchaeota archaeon]|nr:30S ribosomal protein S2 [Candidatus Aenigmarchaeota archaeon]
MELLIPSEDYKKFRMNKGELSRNKKLDRFMSWETPSGRNMFSIPSIDERIRVAAKFLAPKREIAIVCSDLDYESAKEFAEATGAKLVDNYRQSLFSNPKNARFTEPEVVLVTNADERRNVVAEANLNSIPLVAFCNTNSDTSGIDLIVPLNVTNRKSLGVALWLLANEIRKLRGETEIPLDKFSSGDEE